MAKVYTTLHRQNDTSVEIYPNVDPDQNIPNNTIAYGKLDATLQNMITHPINYIADNSIVLNKLDQTIIDAINSSITFDDFNTTFLDELKTAFQTYGLLLAYTYGGGSYTITLTNIDVTFDVTPYHDMTINKVIMHMMDDHITGMLVLEINEQITANDNLYLLADQDLRPNVDTFLVAFKNGALVVAKVDEDGYISVNTGLDTYDQLVIKFDWWV